MANHFGARVAISRFQRLKTHGRSHPGRCPGLLHFAPLAGDSSLVAQGLPDHFTETFRLPIVVLGFFAVDVEGRRGIHV